MFETPAVNSVITVTTRFPETNILATNTWRDNVYVAVQVLPPEKWFKPDDIKVTSDNPNLPFRVINMGNVVDLRYVDGHEAEQNRRQSGNFSVEINGSKGKTYTVTFVDGTPSTCTCPGFVYRQRCRHLAEAKQLVDNQKYSEYDLYSGIEPSCSTTNERGNDIMSNKGKTLSWNDRFALIDHYQPSDEQACDAFGVTLDELNSARAMRQSGTFSPSDNIDIEAYASMFNQNEQTSTSTATATSASTTKSATSKKSKTSSVTSTKNSTSKQKSTSSSTSQKRPGRRGTKIASAFAAVPTTPTDAEAFAKQHGVSLAVLRQGKRFDTHSNDQGPVRVKKDKEKGTLMVWRETVQDSSSESATSHSS